jgi:hypothetical protein
MEIIRPRCYCAKTFAEKPMSRVAGDALAMKIESTIFSEWTLVFRSSLLRCFLPLQWAPGVAAAVPDVTLHSDTATAVDFRNGNDFHRVRVDTSGAVVFGNRSHRKEH